MRIFAGKPEDMGKRYAAIVQEARMPGFPLAKTFLACQRSLD